jgi:ABC-type lipoprotein export system ATPase subunit
MPTSLGSLDAIHLATVLALAKELGEKLVIATHDRQLAAAAKAFGFDVVGSR